MATVLTTTVNEIRLENFHAPSQTHASDHISLSSSSKSGSNGNQKAFAGLGKSGSATGGDPSDPPADEVEHMSRLVKLRLLSCCLCFATAGVNDSSLGALIPYIMKHYGISTGLVAIVYIPTFIGWLLAAVTQNHLHAFFGMGGVLLLGAISQLASNVIRCVAPTYGLFAFSFFLAGIGIALQDAQANTYVSGLKTAHRYLGLIHAMYGVGCTVGPLIATAIASNSGKWNLAYTVMVGLNTPNVLLVALCFRDVLFKRAATTTTSIDSNTKDPESEDSNPSTARKATNELVASLKSYPTWIFSLFFFFYLGAAISVGGWVVEFLVDVRGGELSKMGYIPIALNGGMALGRIALPDITYKFGERRMIAVYIVIAIAMQLVFWHVPNIAANAVALGLLGFFSGPLFGTGISVATKIIPKELHVSAIGLIFVIGQAGGALFPYITGLVAVRKGVLVLQPIATALFAAAGVTWLLAPTVKKRSD